MSKKLESIAKFKLQPIEMKNLYGGLMFREETVKIYTVETVPKKNPQERKGKGKGKGRGMRNKVCLLIVLLFNTNIVLSQKNMYQKILSGIYVEIQNDTTNLRRYTEDNEIYKADNEYYFSFLHVDENNNEYYYDCNNNDIEDCKYISTNNVSDTTTVGIFMKITPVKFEKK
jgi:hypothetical protein